MKINKMYFSTHYQASILILVKFKIYIFWFANELVIYKAKLKTGCMIHVFPLPSFTLWWRWISCKIHNIYVVLHVRVSMMKALLTLMRTTLQRQVPHRQLEDRSGVEGEAEEVVQEAVQLGSEEVEAEDGVVEVQGKEHFLDKRTCVEFWIFKLKQGHVNRYIWSGV